MSGNCAGAPLSQKYHPGHGNIDLATEQYQPGQPDIENVSRDASSTLVRKPVDNYDADI